ncbi:unnamed protein product [Parnassius mnemosyne]|uniref:RNase H type-1 domain-containing protein n=1 Tax=Parnassius mnemosyne TaxID=213953 RepID=A0AAV1L6I3_9NEOP
MVITNKLKYDSPHLNMDGIGIGMSEEIKVLGVTVDRKITFNTHVRNVCRKATALYGQLSRAAKISLGFQPVIIRTMYTAVVEPVVLYAASVWAPAASKLGMKKQLNAVQRGFAQKICRAYRIVSLHSALTFAGLLPLDLRVQEAAFLFEAKRASQMDLEFICLGNEYETRLNNTQSLRIFTDGSKIEGKVGAALSFWNIEAETGTIKLKLSDYFTVYQAEILAIFRATECILSRKEQSFGVYSDSRAALETMVNQETKHPLAVKTRKNIQAVFPQHKSIQLFWIKAHAGLPGNERADELAKQAALRIKGKSAYDLCQVSFIKRQIRLETLEKWNRRYIEGDAGGTTKIFLPNAVNA